jgi:hypothetical protein
LNIFGQYICSFEGERLLLECTLTLSVPKARVIARTWEVDARQAVEHYLDMVDVHKRDVMQQIWEEVDKAVSAANLPNNDGAVMFTLAQDHMYVVVGMKSLAKGLFDKLSSIVKAMEDEIEKRKQEVTETNGKLKSFQLRLLLAVSFQVEAGKRHEGLKVNINLQKNTIMFHGQMKDVRDAQVEMYEILNNNKSDKISGMSDMQRKLLDSKEVKPHIVQKFKGDNISAVWEVQGQDVQVYSFDDASLVKAIHIIRKSVPEHVCELNPESCSLLNHRDWQSLVKELQGRNAGTLLIVPAADGQQVFITCIDSIMHGVLEEIERFLLENTIYSQVVKFPPSRQKFIAEYWQQKVIAIQNNLKAYHVQIVMKEAGTELNVKGTTTGLAEVKKHLEKLNSDICYHEEHMKDPRIVRFLTAPNANKELSMLSKANRCVIALQPEPQELQVSTV